MMPLVHVASRKRPGRLIAITLPGATLAYQAADIYARANGYVEKRNVDIGSHVKSGDMLAVLTAPELDHQIAQAEAAKPQAKADMRQNDANANSPCDQRAQRGTGAAGLGHRAAGRQDRLTRRRKTTRWARLKANDDALDQRPSRC